MSDQPSGVVAAAEGVSVLPLPSPTLPPFTHTNAVVLSADAVGIVVDPGGSEASATERIAEALAQGGVSAPKGVFLTHTHRDHLAGVDACLGRWPDLQVWAPTGELARCDPAWRAIGVRDGRRLTLGATALEVVATPGHALDHMALWWPERRLLVAGDLVAGEGSIWVGLPDGDVGRYLASLARAAALEPDVIVPAHGPVRRDGATVLHDARRHRLRREADVVERLRAGASTLSELRAAVYPELPVAAHDLAERSLLAHLLKLMRERRVAHLGDDERGPYAVT